MLQYDIIQSGKVKKIKGNPVGKYFAIDLREGDWCITHIPSGHTLTSATFANSQDAVYFAELCEKTYGDLLETSNERVLLDNRYDVGLDFYAVRNRLEDLDVPVTKEKIDEIITRL